MLKQEELLICDLAETYGIYDFRSLPARTVATLACGLRENSRIKMKLSGEEATFEQMMLINIYDRLNWLAWSRTKAAQDGGDAPEPLLNAIIKPSEKNEKIGFTSGEEFERYKESILRGENNA